MAPRRNHSDFKFCKNFILHENVTNKNKIDEFCGSYHTASQNRKDRVIQRVKINRRKKLNIPRLVYKFLENVASRFGAEENNERKSKRSSSMKRSGNNKFEKRHSHPDKTKSIDESRTSVSTSRSKDTNSTIRTVPSTPASNKSWIKTKQKFSIQAIKDYIRAGIAEGKRRAKKYMCKALSFGVDTGYLIPTDSDGQVLRVSSALISFTTQKDEGKNRERGIRQKLRRGGLICTSKERKLLRRRENPDILRKRERSPSSVASSTSSTERPKAKKANYGKRIKKHRSRSPKKVKLKRGPKRRPRNRINLAKLKSIKSRHNIKEVKNRGDNKRDREKLRVEKEKLTPSRSEEDNDKSIKKKNPFDTLIE